MYLNSTMSLTYHPTTNDFEFNNNGIVTIIPSTSADFTAIKHFYNAMRQYNPAIRASVLTANPAIIPAALLSVYIATDESAPVEEVPAPVPDAKEIMVEGLRKMINFFSEFAFTPSFRFVNTISRNYRTPEAAQNFIAHYFSLMDSCYASDVANKMKSEEFSELINNIMEYPAPASVVNSRMKVYYGPAGTGKTTIAQQETDNRCIVCNSAMLPSDLMEDFVFDSGNPTFNPSILCECMEKGLPIVLDEINLLPFDSLRFLQGITDGKKSIIYKNRTININDGFQIIGTMNLSLGGATYGLPEPLVDRCSEIKEFSLSAEQLAAAIIG